MAKILEELLPITQQNVGEAIEAIFAPWIKQMGFADVVIREGYCAMRLPQDTDLQFFSGAICGQALMAAIDTAASLAVLSGPRPARGTAYQHTHFLRPAANEDLSIEAEVKRFGRGSAYVDCSVSLAESKKLCAHAVLEFAY